MDWQLTIDTSTSSGTLFATDASFGILKEASWDADQKHSEVLTQKFERLAQDLSLKNLTTINVVYGPGSFTGLRVAATFAKTLSYAAGKVPLRALSSFSPLGHQLALKDKTMSQFSVLIPSIAGKFFISDFQVENNKVTEHIMMSGAQETLKKDPQTCYTTHPKLAQSLGVHETNAPNAASIAATLKDSEQHILHIKSYTYLDFYPLYLRQSEAEEKFRYDSFNTEKKTK